MKLEDAKYIKMESKIFSQEKRWMGINTGRYQFIFDSLTGELKASEIDPRTKFPHDTNGRELVIWEVPFLFFFKRKVLISREKPQFTAEKEMAMKVFEIAMEENQ